MVLGDKSLPDRRYHATFVVDHRVISLLERSRSAAVSTFEVAIDQHPIGEIGGARVALACFSAMGVVVAILLFQPGTGGHLGYHAFLSLFSLLFIASGAGNGAVFQMIPVVFVADRRRAFAGQADAAQRALREGTLESAASLGFASAIAAFGGFFIPKAYGTAVSLTGGTAAALYPFLVFYVSCAFVTWWFYARDGAESPC